MKKPALPPDETLRLAALHSLGVLDSPREQRFDSYVAFAAKEFGVKTAAISLIEAHRQWFKASIGLDACETSRDVSFCTRTILQATPFVIEDASQDERFADNPLVTGAPFIRFYAGAPLLLPSGFAVGALCLIDTIPRRLTAVQLETLTTLSRLVVDMLLEKPD